MGKLRKLSSAQRSLRNKNLKRLQRDGLSGNVLQREKDRAAKQAVRQNQERRETEREADAKAKKIQRMHEDLREVERKRNAESMRKAREDEQKREVERKRNAESMRIAREDEQKREVERKRNAESMRKAREDEQKREVERKRNAESMRKARENEEKRETEKQKDKSAKRKAREQIEKRQSERIQNGEAMRNVRQEEDRIEAERIRDAERKQREREDEEKRGVERLRNCEAMRRRRESDELRRKEKNEDSERHKYKREQTANGYSDYISAIKKGPTIVCVCCDGLFFSASTRKLNRGRHLETLTLDLQEKVLRTKISDDEYLCSTCFDNIKDGKVPILCFSNGFIFPEIPPVLKGLTKVEELLVAGRIPFMTITKLGIDGQCGLKGNVINIVNPVNETAKVLPRNFDETSVIQIMFMRKISFNHAYAFETIRPMKVYTAAKYLAQTELYQEEGILLSEDWLAKMPGETLSFVVDEEDRDKLKPSTEETDLENQDELNPGGQETLLVDLEEDDVSDVVKFAPGEGQRPLSLLKDINAQALSFPTSFAGQARKFTDSRITRTHIAKSDARNKDRRCCNPMQLLYSFKYLQTYQVFNGFSLCLRKTKGTGMITANELLNDGYVKKLINDDEGYRMIKNVRGSPSYWECRQKNLFASIRQLGIPTLFITLSAAEVKWNQLIVILTEVLESHKITEEEAEQMPWKTKADLIRRDPITCARYFDYRWRQCRKFLILNNTGLFEDYPVLDYFSRIEFQHRGSPHMHGLFWLKDAPKFVEDDVSSHEACCQFVDKYISCDSTAESAVFQSHKHTTCCEVKIKDKVKCRFGIPYPPMKKTTILVPFPLDVDPEFLKTAKNNLEAINGQLDYVHRRKETMSYDEFLTYMGLDEQRYLEAIRSGTNRPKVFLKRQVHDAFCNAYNPDMAKLWCANMDIQFILDPYACSKYCAAYVSKSCRGMSLLMRGVVEEVRAGNLTAKEKLQKFAKVFLNGTEVSAQEAAYMVLGIPICESSKECVFINTGPASQRVKITKSEKELQALPEDSTDTTIDGLLEHYTDRPDDLEDLTLAEFAANWTYSTRKSKSSKFTTEEEDLEHLEFGQPTDSDTSEVYALKGGKGFIKLRTKSRIIRSRNYGQVKEAEEFLREQLMLYLPWRDEQRDIIDTNMREIYDQNITRIEELRKLFDKRIDISEDVKIAYKEEDAEGAFQVHDEFKIFNDDKREADFGLEVGEGEEKFSKLKMPNMLPHDDYKELLNSLNEKQKKYHEHVVGSLSNNCIYEFVSGGAGVGKSTVITAITQTLMRKAASIPGKDPSRIKVLLCAPTGVAAYNIGGYTLHQAFGLPFNQFKKEMPRLNESNRNRIASDFSELELIIIDEVSMMSQDQLFQVDARLRQIFTTSSDFGGKSILTVGDFNQLDPVMALPVFAEPNKGKAVIGANYLWPKFRLFELTESMRQKNDQPFAEALNRLAVGFSTEEDVVLFKSREIALNKLTPPPEAVRLKFRNQDVDNFNCKILSTLNAEGVIANANDRVQGTGNAKHIESIRAAAKQKTTKETQGLAKEVNFKIGAKYMMTLNLDTSDGLVNGAIGMLRKITYAINPKTDKKLPYLLWMEFGKGVGQKRRSQHKKLRRSENVSEGWVPIGIESRSIHKWPGRELEVVRQQFPFVAAEAITIHKSQGSTFKEVVVAVEYTTDKGSRKTIPRRALYVALSRCTSLSGLFIEGLFSAPGPPGDDDKFVREMARLRQNPVCLDDTDGSDVKAGLHREQSMEGHRNKSHSNNSYNQPIQIDKRRSCENETTKNSANEDGFPAPGRPKSALLDPIAELSLEEVSRNNTFRIGSFCTSVAGVSTLFPGEWIDDEIIEIIGTSLVTELAPGSHFIPVFFIHHPSLFPRSLRNDKALANRCQLYTVLNTGNHWVMVEVNHFREEMIIFDSLPHEDHKDVVYVYREKLVDVGVNCSMFNVRFETGCSIQPNGFDCGPFALLFLERRLQMENVSNISAQDILTYRFYWTRRILETSELGNRILLSYLNDVYTILRRLQIHMQELGIRR